MIIGCAAVYPQTTEQSPQKSASQSSAAQEASRLSAEVVTLFQQKKYVEALPLARKAVEIREREFGKSHLLVAQSYRNLAYIQLRLDKRKDAEDSFEKAFDIYEKNHPLTAADEKIFVDLLETVAINQAFDGEIDKAEKKLRRAIELRENLNGKDDVVTADALSRLAEIYQAKGDNEKAAPLLLRALDIKDKKLGTENEATEEAFESVSCILNKLGRKSESDKIENKLYPPQPGDSPVSESGVINGKAIKLIVPSYPAEAKINRVSGKVDVKVTIDERGKVIRACAVAGAKELQRTSEIAAYQSVFSPTLRDNKPIKVTGSIIYNFTPR